MSMGRYHRQRVLCPAGLVLLTLLSGCTAPLQPEPEPGVSHNLAQTRRLRIQDLRYQLRLSVPADRNQPIKGEQLIAFDYHPSESGNEYLVIDFESGAEAVESLAVNGRSMEVVAANGHLLLPESELPGGRLELAIQFQAGDSSLNRREEYLYTLFVPDRASEAIPCFDQPDLKASFSLHLEIPEAWTAVSNGPATRQQVSGERRVIEFAPTRPISTYLFAFAAGRFQVEEGSFEGRSFRFLHKENDAAKVERNRTALFELHGQALRWLENYTGIEFPFEKFDFVLLPAFQFGGMEHPGSVFYRDERLLLDQSPTQNEILGRASLIAHETAHMWFGDLVTMAWFDDVWTKEVFANFMAAKLTQPQFPEIDHDLRFFLGHYPSAYAVDRSAGTHPVRQQLDNLNDAASLYGAIIYQKAPIVMRQLELLIGEEAMQSGLQEYLEEFAYGNARWVDLVRILDARSALDLQQWSRVWVESAGRPHVRLHRERAADGREFIRLVQEDPANEGRLWLQPLRPLFWSGRGPRRLQVALAERELTLGWIIQIPSIALPNAGGVGYGRFQLPRDDQQQLLVSLSTLPTPLDRAVAVETLWDAVLENELPPLEFLNALQQQLAVEEEELVISRLLSLLDQVFWGFLEPAQRIGHAPQLEKALWDRLRSAPSDSLRLNYFRGLRGVAVTPEATQRVRRIWDGSLQLRGLSLSESDQIETALELAVRDENGAEALLSQQLGRLEQPYRKEQFSFVSEAVSPNPGRRKTFFLSLARRERRSREPWVLQALRYLHHPLRSRESEQFIRPSLEMLQEIKRTGDIFFPKRWLDATLDGYQNASAAQIVEDFLLAHPGYPTRLKGKILQSADMLFRRARALNKTESVTPASSLEQN